MNVPFSYSSPTLSVEALKHSIAYKLMFIIGKDPAIANKHEWLNATLFAVRDRMVERWLRSNRAQLSQEVRQVYYLSMEFLIGRTLSNALLSLGIYEDVNSALEEMGLNLEELIDEENDPGLGNGGLGRLAACFLDSLAALGLPGRGYGIRYDYGMFKQNIVDGRQKESPDYWLEYGNPWEFERHNTRYKVRFGGRIQQEGKYSRWVETEEIIAEAYDQIIPGFDTDATNTLRLWSAQASSEINLGKFNQGDYFAAVEDKNHSENVSRVLYPDDSTYSGRELRLRQEYFLVSATVQDILSRHYQLHKTYANLADKIAIHLNDTHPVLSIPELMRLLIDEHKFNGVSELHSRLMVESLFAEFAKIFPMRFTNVTNGVTPRRWLALANPPLSKVLDENIGHTWRTDLSQLKELEQHIDYPKVNQAVRQAKLENKQRLANYIGQQLNVVVNPKALFDVQIKRIHEYKRQLMNVLHVITRYNRIKANPDAEWVPRVNIFAGKAASAYYMAKHIIHLINDVAAVVNNDPQIGDKLKVVFIPNYSVSLAQLIIPAADLSEQISLAGTEASGTSNMKFALNGALTIGTLDGANVEMQEHVGADNFFIFGNTAEEVEALRADGYKPRDYYEQDEELHQALTQIGTGLFSPSEPGRYRDLLDSLINFGDHYQVLADFRSYVDCQDKVDELYLHPEEWANTAMLNIANMGYFSSDRTIKEYADHIWHIDPVRL